MTTLILSDPESASREYVNGQTVALSVDAPATIEAFLASEAITNILVRGSIRAQLE